MAHEILTLNGKASMAYAGETPWHGLGQALTPDASIEVWSQEAGMNFTIAGAPVLFMDELGLLRSYSDRQVLRRTDTNVPLSIVSNQYKVVQPTEIMDFFAKVTEAGGFKMETAGVLFQGQKYWALAKAGEGFELPGGDRVAPYLLLATACDGTLATTGMFTTTRVVCQNTLQMSIYEGESSKARRYVKIPHSRAFDADQMRAELGLIDDSFSRFQAATTEMAKRRMRDTEVLNYFVRVLRKQREEEEVVGELLHGAAIQEQAEVMDMLLNPSTPTEEQQEVESLLEGADGKTVQRMFQLYAGSGRGSDLQSADGTLWGAVNAVTQVIDHERGRTVNTRLNSAWFGDGASTKQRAWDEALKLVA